MKEKEQDPPRRALTADEIEYYNQETGRMLADHLNGKEIQERLIALGAPEDFIESTIPQLIKRLRKKNRKQKFSNNFERFAGPIFVFGMILFFGNSTGILPTFPYAGFLMMALAIGIFVYSHDTD